MLDEKEFQRKADAAFEDLKRRLLVVGDEHGFDVEGESGKLEVIFEEPEDAKFVVSPNTPVREIWISALSTSFKLDWSDASRDFVLQKTGEGLKPLVARLINQQLGEEAVTMKWGILVGAGALIGTSLACTAAAIAMSVAARAVPESVRSTVLGIVSAAGSLGALLSQGPVTPALAHLFTDKQGFTWLSEDDFVNHFAADVDPVKARVMYAVQQALAASAFQDVMGIPAWKALPSWFLVATDDQALPPDAQRLFARRMGATTIEVPSSHVAMVSHPQDVVQLIKTAAQAAVTA